MNRFFHSPAWLSLVLLLFIVFAATVTFGQTKKQTFNKDLISALVAKKELSGALGVKRAGAVILTPSETRDLLAEQADSPPDLGDPCSFALGIEFGQTINGQLANTDCQLSDSSYADFYTFNALAGEGVTVKMSSGAFDAFLGLANESGTFVVEDDDGGGGTNARIDVTLPETGLYLILANSTFPNQFGAYSVSLSGGPTCNFSFSPSSATIPAAGGLFNVDVITDPRCYWVASGVTFEVTTQSSGLGSGTITYTVLPNDRNQVRSLSITVRNTRFNIRQDPIACSYSFNPASISVGPDETTGTVSVTATPGCLWGASGHSDFISASGSALGNGTFNYSISYNNGASRSGWIDVDNQQVPVTQSGRNCTFSTSPFQINAGPAGTTGTFVINTQPGCAWFLDRNQNWVDIPNGLGLGSGPATIPFRVLPYLERLPRDASIQLEYDLNGISFSSFASIDQIGRFFATTADFDGDGKTDLSTYRPSDGNWYAYRSSGGGASVVNWGLPGDIPVPADFDGDGKIDRAMYRPSTGQWLILRSSDLVVNVITFGVAGDRPVPGDYDRDGKADIAQFRPSDGNWYVFLSSIGRVSITTWGSPGDIPVPGDYSGDGVTDVAVYRPSTGVWYEFLGPSQGARVIGWGIAGDVPVQADYDGDGKTDVAQFRPSDGNWYIFRSSDNGVSIVNWGAASDVPVPGDYDGDGIADPAVFRNGTWFAARSTGGAFIANWGTPTDIPIPSPRFQ